MKPFAELAKIAERVKRATRNPDILDLCDAVLERQPPERTPMILGPEETARRLNAQARVRMRRMRARLRAAAQVSGERTQ